MAAGKRQPKIFAVEYFHLPAKPVLCMEIVFILFDTHFDNDFGIP